jgi:hypothetical protein
MKAITRREMLDMIAPLAGAVAGGVACTVVSNRFHLRREVVGVGAIAVGLAVAGRSRGLAQQLATGLAAAGASVLAIAILTRLRPDWTMFGVRPGTPAADPVTRREMRDALSQSESAREQQVPAEQPTEPAGAHDTVEAVAYSLTPEERATLERLRQTTAAPIVAQVEQQLRALSVDDGVAFLRTYVLPHGGHSDHAA